MTHALGSRAELGSYSASTTSTCERTWLHVGPTRVELTEDETGRLSEKLKNWFSKEVVARLKTMPEEWDRLAEGYTYFEDTFDEWRVTFTDSGSFVVYLDGYLMRADERIVRYELHRNATYDDNEPTLANPFNGGFSTPLVLDVPCGNTVCSARFESRRGSCGGPQPVRAGARRMGEAELVTHIINEL